MVHFASLSGLRLAMLDTYTDASCHPRAVLSEKRDGIVLCNTRSLPLVSDAQLLLIG